MEYSWAASSVRNMSQVKHHTKLGETWWIGWCSLMHVRVQCCSASLSELTSTSALTPAQQHMTQRSTVKDLMSCLL